MAPTLKERYEHLDKAFKTLLKRRRDWKRRNADITSFVKLKVRFIRMNRRSMLKQKVSPAYPYFRTG